MRKNNGKMTLNKNYFKRMEKETKVKHVSCIATALNQHFNEGYGSVAFTKSSETELSFYLFHPDTGVKLRLVKVLD